MWALHGGDRNFVFATADELLIQISWISLRFYNPEEAFLFIYWN